MKKLWNCLAKIKIHYSTIILYFVVFLTGKFIPFFIYFLIASIHECSHIFIAKMFKLKVKRIEIYPFGLSATLDFLNTLHPFKSILILIAGPLSFFLSYLVLKLLFFYDFLSYNMFIKSLEINRVVALFNLLPIWPLDGSKIMFYLLSFFITLKKCYYFVIGISIISTLLIVIKTIKNPQLVIITFLIISQIQFIISYHFEYLKTLVARLNNKKTYKIKIHRKKDIFLPYENYYFDDIILLDERCLIKNILNRKKEWFYLGKFTYFYWHSHLPMVKLLRCRLMEVTTAPKRS